MNKILIICDSFPPSFNPRMGYLCKYLLDNNWQPVIVTEFYPSYFYKNLSENQNVKYINFYFSKSHIISKIRYFFVFCADFFFNYKKRIFYKECKKLIKNDDIKIVLSSSSSKTFVAGVAARISKENNIPFIMDLRDIAEQFPNYEDVSKNFRSKFLSRALIPIISNRYKNERNKYLNQANVVTTVSEWHKNFLKNFNPNTELIFNGYDDDIFKAEKIISEKFIISYTGNIETTELKDPRPFLEAVGELFQEKKINPENFEIDFYFTKAMSNNIMEKLLKDSSIKSLVKIFDSVQNTELPKILNKSSILLLLANKECPEGPKGIMGTKLFEYIAVEKPIMCIKNDEACIEATIKETNSGIACSDIPTIKNFIMEKFEEWKEKSFTKQDVNKIAVKKYSRRNQSQEFIKIINLLITN